MSDLFFAVDGDDVGRRLEYYMLLNDSHSLTSFSNAYKSAMNWLEEELVNKFGATVLFSGGDNLLACVRKEEDSMKKFEELRINFSKKSESTISAGLGLSLQEAYFALKLAKATGKNRICDFQELQHG